MPRTDDSYKILRNETIQGKLNPGGRLVEYDLCERRGPRRGYVREALKLHRVDGFVILNHGRGATVAKVSYQETKKSKNCGWFKTCSVNERSFSNSRRKDPLRKDTVTSVSRYEAEG